MRRRRSRSFGALDFKSPTLWAGLAALGLGAYFLFRPKKAAALPPKKEEKPAASTAAVVATGTAASVTEAAAIPAGSATGATAEVSSATTPQQTFVDPGSGVKVAGPSGTVGQDQKRTVAKGESWSNIASRAYGDYRWWPYLWDANRGGAKFADPSMLRAGDEIVVPKLPGDAEFKKAIFARAEADRKWEAGGKKGARPASTFASTNVPLAMLPPGSPVSLPPAGGGVTTPTVSTKEPLVMGAGSKMGPGNVPTTDVMVSSDMDALESSMRSDLRSR